MHFSPHGNERMAAFMADVLEPTLSAAHEVPTP
jgi:hypothetical protein